MAIKQFVGTKKANQAKDKIEFIIKVIASPIWLPLWLFSSLCYYVVQVIEENLFRWLDAISDRLSTLIVRKFFNY